MILIVAVFYILIPFTGAFFSRYKWRNFRRRFYALLTKPLLDYKQYRLLDVSGAGNPGEINNLFRFTGSIESITDGRVLWVKGEGLTIPVSLDKTQCRLLPMHKDEGIPEAPQQIHWNRISTISEGTKVFIGGILEMQNNRLSFVSTKENPLTVIFYDCDDDILTDRIVRVAWTKNEYWNTLTPISVITGALLLLYIAVSLLARPAFRLTVISSLVAIFIPVLPLFPPGLLFTFLYRRMAWYARRFRTYRDLVRLPGINSQTLAGKRSPGSVKFMAKNYAVKAYTIEFFAWIILAFGVVFNIIFIFIILSQLNLVSF